jgi:basic membrane protein A
MDSHNASLVSAEMLTAVEAAKAKIIAGEIEIHDAMSDNSCPAS